MQSMTTLWLVITVLVADEKEHIPCPRLLCVCVQKALPKQRSFPFTAVTGSPLSSVQPLRISIASNKAS